MNADRPTAERKPNFLPGNVVAWFRRDGLMARLGAAMATLAPLGYQDEMGFHFGMENGFSSFRFRNLSEAWETSWL